MLRETRLDPARPSQVLHELALGVVGECHFFTFSPSSTSQTMADREDKSGWRLRQSSIAATSAAASITRYGVL